MRSYHRMAEVTGVEDDGRTFAFVAVRYNVVDSYGTIFAPGCFAESLQRKLPQITWAHDTSDIIGRVVSYEDTPDELRMVARLSEPESVPRAKQAMAQIRDGDIDEMSVGGRIGEDDQIDIIDGREIFKRIGLDEVAVVLAGAVPGAKVLAIRSRSKVISVEAAGEIAARLKTGEIDLLQALQELKDTAVDEPEKVEVPETPEDPPEPAEPVEVEPAPAQEEAPEVPDEVETADEELDALLAEADEALAKAE